MPKRTQFTPGDNQAVSLPLDTSLFIPGDRVCVAVSGGADSTALFRALLARREELGIVLSVLHVEHGLRGAASMRDADFVRTLAGRHGVPCEVVSVDTPQRVRETKESVEEAARNLRYEAFRAVLRSGHADKVATAHTLDDQAETVLMKLLRGAWTGGLSGIHPVLQVGEPVQVCVRPLLGATRAEIVLYLESLEQPWQQDETNDSADYTRNRIRHELMPVLRGYNPRISGMLAHMAANARAEEQHWQQELARLLPQLLLPGKSVRGGGRRVLTAGQPAAMAVDIHRLQALDSGLRRRVLRTIAAECGATLDFDATERLDALAGARFSSASVPGLELPGGLQVRRTARELQFEPRKQSSAEPMPEYILPVPGVVEAPVFGARFRAVVEGNGAVAEAVLPPAQVRCWRAGDRVQLEHSSGPKKVKEVLDRMGLRGDEKIRWPVVAWQGKILWMRGVRLARTYTEGSAAVPTICESPSTEEPPAM